MSLVGLLDVSRRALSAQTQAIRTAGDNIANVNTPGYSRRRVDFVTTTTQGPTAARVGTGVDINSISRVVDQFLNSELLTRSAERSMADIRNEFLQRAETPFAVDNTPGALGYQLNEFFSALQDLSTNPTDIPLRTQVLERGQELSESIRQTYDHLAQLQREANDRIGIQVNDVNRITASIASLNQQITTNEYTANQEAITLRDQRDQLLRELAEKVSFRTVEDSDGQIMVYLNNGFALVNGSQSRDLSYVTDPSFAPAGGFPPGLDGNPLGFVVFTYPGGAQADLTQVVRGGSGEIAGLLALRGTYTGTPGETTFDADGDLVEIASRVEAVARDLLTRFNTEYRGPDADNTTAGFQPSARDLDGNAPGVFGLFTFGGAADGDADGIAEEADLNALVAAGTHSSFARLLTFGVGSERAFAAARDTDPANPVAWATGDDANIQGLLKLRGEVHTYNVGAVNYGSKIDEFVDTSYAAVGSTARRAKDEFEVFQAREDQVKELQMSVSGVNIDEELAKLISYQKGYQASARMIRMADDLLSELMQLMG